MQKVAHMTLLKEKADKNGKRLLLWWLGEIGNVIRYNRYQHSSRAFEHVCYRAFFFR